MTFLRIPARLAALVLGGLLVASCDSRLPTTPGGGSGSGGDPGDLSAPTIKFALSAGTNNVVDLGASLTVTVTATDDNGVQTLNTTLNNGATVIGADTSTFKPTQKTSTRSLAVPMSGRKDGDRIVIRSTAGDASLNFKTDSIIVTIADTTAPKMTMSSKAVANNPNMKGGDSLDVQVTASDSSGVQQVGYRVYRLGGADSTTVQFGDSVSGAAGATVAQGSFKRLLQASMNIGTYRIVGFATDNSGRVTNPGPTLQFTIVDAEAPTLTFVAPAAGATLNIGDQLFVRVNLHDNVGLKTVKFYAVSPRGDIALGTADTVMRYDTVTAPQNGALFRTGLTDTLDLRRYLSPRTPVDTLPGKLLVYGVVTDMAGNVTRDTVSITMTKGPNVTLLAPIQGDSLTRGTKLRISVSATSGVGVTNLGFDVKSGTSGPVWPTPVVATYDTTISPANKNAGPFTVDIDIPPDAPSKGILTIAPHATDVNFQPGVPTPQDFAVRVGAAPPPLVRQTIAARVELTDSVTVYASGAALTQVGYVIRDVESPNTRVDSNAVTANSSSFGPKGITFNLATKWQGKRVSISAFAKDSAGNIGWAAPASVNTPVTDTTKMARDTALVVYGRTYALPTARNGLIADVVVDQPRGNVFLSNIGASRLEVWQEASRTFDPTGIFVGSQPWGMTISRTNGDTMYVANSGGTNLSRVYIGAASPSGMKEDLAHRIDTRISLLYKVTEARDAATGKIRLTLKGPILFSDRPQYIQQAAGANGRLYLSTKPTTASGQRGTIRYLDTAAPAPDQRFILAFASAGSDPNSYLIANIDAASITPAPANSSASDVLTLCDHASGSTDPQTCASSDQGIAATVAALQATVPQSDVDAQVNLDETSLGLTDTTYAAASANGEWIAFGEGHRSPYSRAFLLRDDGTNPNGYTYASPSLNIQDLINNASDQIFGLALDKTGQTMGLHGAETYFAKVSQPFTQRLSGKYATFGQGGGIAFHPNADGTSTPQSDRLTFVASSNGTIEMVDLAYFTSRGTLATKANLYGPLRASLPFPGDDPSVILKLFGLSANGLVVIDVTAADIQPGP
ncbi:MAG TPA: hypothetical protein VFY85_07650 [Gemmatimonadaceae bacterium]|nr:hypothetical protein [Gemmatimonadaceae bacterium]